MFDLKREKHRLLLGDLDILAANKPTKSLFKSEYGRVREVWGIVKQLKMSEANLERRVKEFEQGKKEGMGGLDDPTEGVRLRYEGKIKDIESKYEMAVSSLGQEMSDIVKEANNQISSQKEKVKNLEDKIRQFEQGAKTDPKWIEACSFSCAIMVGLLNKWMVLMNMKCVFWELIESIARNTENSIEDVSDSRPNLLSRKYRKVKLVFLSVKFCLRLKFLSKIRAQKSTAFSQIDSTDRTTTTKGRDMYNRLLFISSNFNQSTSHLMSSLKLADASDETGIEKIFTSFFSFKHTEVYPSLPFNMVESIELRSKSVIDEYNKKLSQASGLLENIYDNLTLKDDEIRRMKEEINSLRPQSYNDVE